MIKNYTRFQSMKAKDKIAEQEMKKEEKRERVRKSDGKEQFFE